MSVLNIHELIKKKLLYFQETHKIPNIIFHGPSGSGKRTIVHHFVNSIYGNDKNKIKNLVMYVNCAHGKGIKFIRDELKFFAKTHINSNGGDVFKSIILLNADKLTMDAQSALRRCIELFSHNTRFFIIVEDKYKLLKPILSRFCEIYFSEPEHNGSIINLHKYNLNETFKMKETRGSRLEWLKKELNEFFKRDNLRIAELITISNKLYEKGYTGLDVFTILESGHLKSDNLTPVKKYELLIAFNKVKKEFRNEKLLMLFIFNFIYLDTTLSLENISFM